MAGEMVVSREVGTADAVLRQLSGTLDQSFDPSVLNIPSGHLVIDLSQINRVASFGVRDWIVALRRLRPRLDGLYFVLASSRITDQFNMVVGFDGGGALLSFNANYVCDYCAGESPSLFDVQLDQKYFQSLQPPVRQCRVCGHDAELDDEPSVLFEYVRSTEQPIVPASVMGLFRRPDCWIHNIPGVRMLIRHVVKQNAKGYVLTGIIDDTFRPEKITPESGVTLLSLGRVSHFDIGGFDAWRRLLTKFSTDGVRLELRECPPVMLRRFVQDPSLRAHVDIATVVLPAVCSKCRHQNWTVVHTEEMDRWLGLATTCKKCGEEAPNCDAIADLVGISKVAPSEIAPSIINTPIAAPEPSPPSAERHRDFGDDTFVAHFADKYEILCKLAEGGMAEVYVVRQHGAMGFRRLAVIKRVRDELLTDDRMVRLFIDEAKLAARIDHANVIRVYDLGRFAGGLYMVLEYVYGRSLAEIMRHVLACNRVVPPRLAALIAADLCRGLARAHAPNSNGQILVHRDVTPNNVLVGFDGNVKLVDFGLAGYASKNWTSDTLLGSPAWMAPEIYLRADVRPQSDIWGAGLLLMAMITGVPPFKRSSLEATAHAIVHDKLKRPWRGKGKVPRRLFRIIRAATEKNPDDRYSDAAEMENELRRAASSLRGTIDLSRWVRDLFAHEIRMENEFFRKAGAASFVDALLSADAGEVSRFFRLKTGDAVNGETVEDTRQA